MIDADAYAWFLEHGGLTRENGQRFRDRRFVNTLRVNEACRLLSGTSRTITEIALACGYRNLSSFNHQFLALRRMNPSEYRRQPRRRESRAATLLALRADPRTPGAGIPARRRTARVRR